MAMMPDRRRMRANIVAHHVLHALEPFIDRLDRLEQFARRGQEDAAGRTGRMDTRRQIYRSLFDLLYATGVEVISDADRAAAGLEPRNERGLTERELQIMEARLIEAMLAPAPFVTAPPR